MAQLNLGPNVSVVKYSTFLCAYGNWHSAGPNEFETYYQQQQQQQQQFSFGQDLFFMTFVCCAYIQN